MSEPIISPDGKSMWTGSEWIPLPTADNDTITPSVEISDSVMMGDITQVTNDPKAISEGYKKALREMEEEDAEKLRRKEEEDAEKDEEDAERKREKRNRERAKRNRNRKGENRADSQSQYENYWQLLERNTSNEY